MHLLSLATGELYHVVKRMSSIIFGKSFCFCRKIGYSEVFHKAVVLISTNVTVDGGRAVRLY